MAITGGRLVANQPDEFLRHADRPRAQLAQAVTLAVNVQTRVAQLTLRQQMTQTGLGTKLPNALRSQVFPKNNQASLRAAGTLYPAGNKARDLFEAFDRGVTIKGADGFYLAVPAPGYAAFVRGNPRLTPGQFERRTGIRLRFVYRSTGPSLLVADQARVTAKGNMRRASARQLQRGVALATAPIFYLLPQVTLRKRLDFDRVLSQAVAGMPARIDAEMGARNG